MYLISLILNSWFTQTPCKIFACSLPPVWDWYSAPPGAISPSDLQNCLQTHPFLCVAVIFLSSPHGNFNPNLSFIFTSCLLRCAGICFWAVTQWHILTLMAFGHEVPMLSVGARDLCSIKTQSKNTKDCIWVESEWSLAHASWNPGWPNPHSILSRPSLIGAGLSLEPLA